VTLISQTANHSGLLGAVYEGCGTVLQFFGHIWFSLQAVAAVCCLFNERHIEPVAGICTQQCAGTVVLGGPSLTSRQIIDPACQLKPGAFCRNMLADVTCVVRSSSCMQCCSVVSLKSTSSEALNPLPLRWAQHQQLSCLQALHATCVQWLPITLRFCLVDEV